MSGLATSYEESVGSCPPSPTTPPASAAPRSAPVRRQLDFSGGGDLDGEDDDEFLCRLADDIERGYGEAKLRAPPCVCGRGTCVVERDEQAGRWKYVCPSRPKCNHVAFCEEVDLEPKSQPTSRSHPKPSNPCDFNDQRNPRAFIDPSNNMAGPRTPVNVCPQVTGATTPVNVDFHVGGATALFSDSPQGAGAATLVNFSPRGEGAATLANVSPQGARATTLAKFIQQGAGAATPVQVTPQGAGAITPAKVSSHGPGSNVEEPVCQCTAGKCTKSRIGNEDWYVCPIPKGKGACSFKVPVRDVVKKSPCDEVHQESPSMLHRPIAAVNTPSKSPIRPYGTPSPISPKDICFQCHEKGHWMRDCPQKSRRDDACFTCGMVGHWSPNCPQRKGS